MQGKRFTKRAGGGQRMMRVGIQLSQEHISNVLIQIQVRPPPHAFLQKDGKIIPLTGNRPTAMRASNWPEDWNPQHSAPPQMDRETSAQMPVYENHHATPSPNLYSQVHDKTSLPRGVEKSTTGRAPAHMLPTSTSYAQPLAVGESGL